MKETLFRCVAACAVLVSAMAFGQTHTKVIHHRGGTQTITYYHSQKHTTHKSWYHAVTHRNHHKYPDYSKMSDKQRDALYVKGLKRHHMYGRLKRFKAKEHHTKHHD